MSGMQHPCQGCSARVGDAAHVSGIQYPCRGCGAPESPVSVLRVMLYIQNPSQIAARLRMAMGRVGDKQAQGLKVCRHHFSVGIQVLLFLPGSEGRRVPTDTLCGPWCSREQLSSVTPLRLFPLKWGVLE